MRLVGLYSLSKGLRASLRLIEDGEIDGREVVPLFERPEGQRSRPVDLPSQKLLDIIRGGCRLPPDPAIGVPECGLDHGLRSTLRQPAVESRDVSQTQDRVAPGDTVLMAGQSQADGLGLFGIFGVQGYRESDEAEFH
jgi:hypothetical protein